MNWEGEFVSAGGTRVAAAGRDKTVRVWDTRIRGSLRCELKHSAPEVRVWLSPDRFPRSPPPTPAVRCGSGTRQQRELRWESKETSSVALSPDGTRIFTRRVGKTNRNGLGPSAESPHLRGGGKPLCDIRGFSDPRGLAFSPDGTGVATGGCRSSEEIVGRGEGRARPCSNSRHSRTASQEPCRLQPGRNSGFSPARWMGPSTIWDARTGTPPVQRQEARRGPRSLEIWRTGLGEGEHVCKPFSPDGTRFVTVLAGQKGGPRRRSCGTRTAGAEPARPDRGHTDQVLCAAFSPDGTKIVTGGVDGTAKVWDARTGTPRLEMNAHKGRLLGAAVGQPGRHEDRFRRHRLGRGSRRADGVGSPDGGGPP